MSTCLDPGCRGRSSAAPRRYRRRSSTALGLGVAGAFPTVVLTASRGLGWSQGARAGLLWAWVGGLLLALNAPGPLGPHALALLVSAYVTGFGARTLDRESPFPPAGAAAA